MDKTVFFFIGTEAELIKVFPVIKAFEHRCINTRIISSGQNNIEKSRIWDIFDNKKIDITLSHEREIKKSVIGLFFWFIRTYIVSRKAILRYFGEKELENAPLVVHGDTVSTFMGALLGKKLGMKVCHIEAGLRSHHLFNPFPEEIDRIITSKIARYHFAPGDEPVSNLKNAKGQVINTRYNTIIDSLAFSEAMKINNEVVNNIKDKEYFVFVMHRQENLINKDFFVRCINEIIKLSENMHCVMILHIPTKIALKDTNYYTKLQNNSNFTLLPRVDYFDFMRLLQNAKFTITDGGSNQEELSYMGKPTLIMRKTTERNDGIGKNAYLFKNIENISEMATIYPKWEREPIIPDVSPSDIIVEELLKI